LGGKVQVYFWEIFYGVRGRYGKPLSRIYELVFPKPAKWRYARINVREPLDHIIYLANGEKYDE